MKLALVITSLVAGAAALPAQALTTLYTQNFESPVGYNNDGGDVNIYRDVNQLYGGQPAGFSFAQLFTVETPEVGGTSAWGGLGFQDPAGTAGAYTLGMLSNTQNDLLSLSFSVGQFRYLNFGVDLSSIDLSTFGGPYVPNGGAAPVFQFSLFDNPNGTTGLSGNGVLLDSTTATGTIAPNKYTFDWTRAVAGLDTEGSVNGNVTLQIDLLSGGYAAMDNFVIAASDIRGELPPIPEPGTYALMLLGLAAVAGATRMQALRSRA